jgi:biotin transport system substrate-specific component
MPIETLRSMVLASLMSALIAVGSYIQVPIGPVPIVLTNLFVLLAGLLLGGRWALTSVGLYLLMGAIGIPVFAGGKGGFGHFLGPTGGYLAGYALGAWVTGFISQRSRGIMTGDIVAVVIGGLCIYALGVPWLKVVTKMAWNRALFVGMAPFVVGDALKASAAIVLVRAVRPMLDRRARSFAAD